MEAFFNAVRKYSKPLAGAISWKPTGLLQQTVASAVSRSGITLHTGARTTATIFPAMAGEGRFFICSGCRIPASVDFALESPLCTTLCGNGARVRTVEHLLSALEAVGVDNCRIEITGGDEVPLLDGSAKEWVEAIEEVGLSAAEDCHGSNVDKMAPFILEPVHLWRNDSFLAVFPASTVHITYGIDFPKVPAIGCQWLSCWPMNKSVYRKEIASARTFCVYEEVERLRNSGLIQGGSLENAIVCSAMTGWLNPPLRFSDEACRHKVLDLIGDLSLLAMQGHQGIPVGHIIAFKGGHALHTQLVRELTGRCRR